MKMFFALLAAMVLFIACGDDTKTVTDNNTVPDETVTDDTVTDTTATDRMIWSFNMLMDVKATAACGSRSSSRKSSVLSLKAVMLMPPKPAMKASTRSPARTPRCANTALSRSDCCASCAYVHARLPSRERFGACRLPASHSDPRVLPSRSNHVSWTVAGGRALW